MTNTEPWAVSIEDGKFRFTNATNERAVMVTLQGVGSDLDDAVPAPVGPGESFDVKLRDGAGVRINWSTTPPMRHHTWVYTR
ncbi:hypothetical protein Q3O43_11995 [Rhodococcus aetherivorans]|uniref:hypothetical protein n=1 Tax=Rhodococcus aetherivorans TaxID=191292 RepID=UPI0026EF1360|nr:hypothetical protein [Rhodococcus aetherivorans]WKX00960.1 hypothetical protein Q3O43_11995 [Rhodococcus aetherivorans]